jgi:hypothetical protein
MRSEELKQNVTVYGPLFPEPVQIIIAVPMGSSVKLIGKLDVTAWKRPQKLFGCVGE